MREERLKQFRHDHVFGQNLRRPGESRTLAVIALTGAMMVVELIAGIYYGSMALLADGLHMGSHAVALAINAAAYIYARRLAHSHQFSFGTGKITTLGGYTGAVLLAVFAAIMAWESLWRLFNPVNIIFDQAIVVAIAGLVVNGVSIVILGTDHGHPQTELRHQHDQDHFHHNHNHSHSHSHSHDHNLRSAYLHVLADALTSVLAIIALVAGKYAGAIWLDPLIGIVGALLVGRWSWGLLRDSGAVLLDRQASSEMQLRIRSTLESEHTRIVDLHLWSVGPNVYSSLISLVATDPRSPEYYKSVLARQLNLDHVIIEVHPYQE